MIFSDITYKIRGVVFNVYNNVVGDWDEETYENILYDALRNNGLGVERQKEFEVFYKGNRVGLYRIDLIVDDKIILELKAAPEIFALHQAQVISYLKVTGLPLGMLINFGANELFVKSYPNNVAGSIVRAIARLWSHDALFMLVCDLQYGSN